MTDVLVDPPEQAHDGRRFYWGRYRAPIPRPDFGPRGRLGRLRLKEWCFVSATTDECFVAFALVHLGYAGLAFCYLVERHDLGGPWEYEALTPLGAGVRVAPSSVAGRSRFAWRGANVEVRWADGWEVQLDVPLSRNGTRERLHGALRIDAEPGLALLHPLKHDRPAYTHKAAGMPVRGLLSFRGREVSLDGGLAALDWTRSLALRETRWKWASFATRLPDGRRVGLNLSAEVYDDANGNSQENALFVDGRAYPLSGVDFELPRFPATEPWRVRSRDGDAIDLVFRPGGARTQRLDLALIRSDFVQAFGTWEGRIAVDATAPVDVRDAFGVAEDHYARW